MLELPHAEGSGLADFLPAPSNNRALDTILRWPAWPLPACILVGPQGSGKSHLARIWQARSGAACLRAQDLWEAAAPLRRLGQAASCVVDDADQAIDEVLLFHLYNRVLDRGGSLLLTASGPVGTWPLTLPDLRSRLKAAMVVRIDPPDDELLAAILVKQFADRQLRVEADVILYLVARMERSFAVARSLVAALDRASLRARRPITPVLARDVLDALAAERQEGASEERER